VKKNYYSKIINLKGHADIIEIEATLSENASEN